MPNKPRSFCARQASQHKRPSASARGYTYAWRLASRDYLQHNPLCVECRKQKHIVAAVLVDHVIPHRGDQVLFWDEGNWAALCASCHSRKTVTRDGGFGNKRNAP